MNLQTSGECRRENAHVRHRPRRRTIQYSATLTMESRARGVLDTRLRGYDGGGWIASSQALLAMTLMLHPPPSYSATGSRECAPDDRLRRSIQYAATSQFNNSASEYWIIRLRG